MGKANQEFEQAANAIIKKHFPNFNDNEISKRTSKDNNYLSLTFKVYAESKQQLDALYQDLSAAPEILMAL